MKNQNAIAMAAVSLLLVAIAATNAQATTVCAKYAVDGSLADWGLNLNNDWSQEASWLPNSGVSFVVEDNRDPTYGETPFGVHIRGTGSSYSPYVEPEIQHNDGTFVTQPYGGEHYDMEAIYFDQDADCIYLALVTSENPSAGGDMRPGDLALNLDNDMETGEYGYEYGVKLGDNYLTQFGVYSMPDWEVSFYFPSVKPTYFITASENVGSAQGAYVDTGKIDNDYTNYVVEVAIPKSALGNPEDVGMNNMHIADGCGNDYIPAPEFLFVAVPVTIIGIVLVFAHRSAKKSN